MELILQAYWLFYS